MRNIVQLAFTKSANQWQQERSEHGGKDQSSMLAKIDSEGNSLSRRQTAGRKRSADDCDNGIQRMSFSCGILQGPWHLHQSRGRQEGGFEN
jgi:hypothetical protein